MRFGNSLRLLMENFKNTFKLLVYRLTMSVLVVALCSAFVLPELMEIANEPVTQELIANVKNIFLSFVSPKLEAPGVYIEAVFSENGNLHKLFDFIVTMKLELILVCAGCVLVYLIKRFIDTVVYFTFGSILNDKMATYSDAPFFTALVANLGKASVYAALYVPIAFVFDVCALGICYLLLRFLPLFSALFLSMTLIVAMQSLKLTLTSQWMPAMISDNMRLREAIRSTGKNEKRQLGKTLCLYVVTVYLVIIVNVIAALFTFGSALLLTVPASYLLFVCTQHVNYYTMKGKKYFITYEQIESNPDHGDSEHFFEYMEEFEKETEETAVVNEEENE